VGGDATSADSFAKNYRAIKKWWTWLTIAISLLTYGFFSFIEHELQPLFSVWQIAWLTLPLTLTVAVISFLLFIKKLTFLRAIGIIWAGFAANAIAGTAAGKRVEAYYAEAHSRWVGPRTCTGTGFMRWCWPDISKGAHMVTSHPHQHFPIVDFILAYLHFYGWIGSLKALLVGCFLGYGFFVIYRSARRIRQAPE
jgi:hypothetical protein